MSFAEDGQFAFVAGQDSEVAICQACAAVGVKMPEDFKDGACQVLAHLNNGGAYFDANLNLLLGSPDALATVAKIAAPKKLDFLYGGRSILTIPVGDDSGAAAPLATDDQRADYIARLGGYPGATGDGQTVAILDTGIADKHPLLPTLGQGDFMSTYRCSAAQQDLSRAGHGTKCAGIIIGGDRERRIGIAPDARLVVGQLNTSLPRGEVVATDFLLHLSWAVSYRGARVVSLSGGAPDFAVNAHTPLSALSKVISALRRNNLALLFCAAGNRYRDPVQIPAACTGAVAVSGYKIDHGGPVFDQNFSGERFDPPTHLELLLGPSQGLRTTAPLSESNDGTGAFSKTSAACAFVAGVAVLYMEKYWKRYQDVNKVLHRMFADAQRVRDPVDPKRSWLGVRFPHACHPEASS